MSFTTFAFLMLFGATCLLYFNLRREGQNVVVLIAGLVFYGWWDWRYLFLRPEPIDPALIDLEDERYSPAAPDAAAVVGWGMARLRRAHADVLEAFYFEGKSVSEIAAERSLSERAVEGRLRRARAKLKKKLSRILQPPAASRSRAACLETERARHTRTP